MFGGIKTNLIQREESEHALLSNDRLLAADMFGRQALSPDQFSIHDAIRWESLRLAEGRNST